MIDESASIEPKETKPANLVALKTTASSVRDTIMHAERESEWSRKGTNANITKHRRNLKNLEGQLVVALPQLVFQVTFDFFAL